jgi:hypothetical protein
LFIVLISKQQNNKGYDMKKINSYQWLSDCGKFGIEKICINDAETKFNYNVCEVYDQWGTAHFEAFETCELLRDAKHYVKGMVQ